MRVCYTTNMTKSYSIRRKEIFLGKELHYGETSDNSFVRLAKKNAGSWKRPVHETWKVDGDVEQLNNPLDHYSGRTITQFVTKLNNYTDKNAQYLFDKGIKTTWIQIIAYPKAKFIKNYFLKRGYKDGTHGFLHAMFMSLHSFLTRAKLWMLWHSSKKK